MEQLELKKETEDGSIFYRYRSIEYGCIFWFSQYNNGNIYRVDVKTNDDIEYCSVRDNNYYPTHFYFNVPPVRIFSRQDYENHLNILLNAERIRFMLESFFTRSVHYKLYLEKHNKEELR